MTDTSTTGRRSIEFRPEDKRRIGGLKAVWEKVMGITLTDQDVVRFALREAAERHGVDVPKLGGMP